MEATENINRSCSGARGKHDGSSPSYIGPPNSPSCSATSCIWRHAVDSVPFEQSQELVIKPSSSTALNTCLNFPYCQSDPV